MIKAFAGDVAADTDLTVDIQKIKYDANGVKNFYWPVKREASASVCEEVVSELARELSIVGDAGVDPSIQRGSQVLFKWLIALSVRLFDAELLCGELKKNPREIDVPGNYRILRSLLVGDVPYIGMFEAQSAGVSVGRNIPWFLRRIYFEARLNGLSLKNMLPRFGNAKNAVMDANALLFQHAYEKSVYLEYDHYAQWFGPVRKSALSSAVDKLDASKLEAIDRLTGIIKTAFANGGLQMSGLVEQSLGIWFAQASVFVDHHLDSISARKQFLPERLWVGSVGSNIWTRIFARAMSENGKEIIAHDHGFGNAHIDQTGSAITEFNDVSEYWTYNKRQAQKKREAIRPDLLWGQREPGVYALKEEGLQEDGEAVTRQTAFSKPLKRIMYVGTAFHGEASRLRPINSDVMYFDWQVRLISFLVKHGFEVLYKPHPEGQTRPPVDFAEKLGAKTINSKFEDIHQTVDAYVIDFIASTTTATVLQSDVPVIYFDVGFPKIQDDARELLGRRCSIMPVSVSAENRMYVDWEAVYDRVTDENWNFDYSFCDVYYS